MRFTCIDAKDTRFNIVYLHTHDTGKFIGPYHQDFDTPSLNWLAKKGTVLDNMFCVGPTCSPSRSGLLTGLYPHQNGMNGLAHRGFFLHNIEQHLCRYLGSLGYETVLCGMQHESVDPTSIGYDLVYISNKKESDDLTAWDEEHAQSACEFIERTHEKPFFLSYGLVQTHRPFLEIDDDIAMDLSLRVPDALPDTRETKEDFARFMTSVRRADSCIGRVLKTLEESDLLDQTIIFYTTDHGAAFPYMKCTLSDDGIGVAGILAFPGNQKKGQRLASLLSHIDFFPTLCDLSKIDKPSWLMGNSFAHLMTNMEDDNGQYDSDHADVWKDSDITENREEPDSAEVLEETNPVKDRVTSDKIEERDAPDFTNTKELFQDKRDTVPQRGGKDTVPQLEKKDSAPQRASSQVTQIRSQQKLRTNRIQVEEINDYIFAEVNYHAAYEPQRCIRSKKYKLIKRYPDLRPDSPDQNFTAQSPRLANIDESITKAKLLKIGRLKKEPTAEDRFRYAETMLFDLEKDPEELVNLAGDPRFAEIEQTLSEKLENWQQETKDELYITGFITAPQNAIINRQICINPDTSDPKEYE